MPSIFQSFRKFFVATMILTMLAGDFLPFYKQELFAQSQETGDVIYFGTIFLNLENREVIYEAVQNDLDREAPALSDAIRIARNTHDYYNEIIENAEVARKEYLESLERTGFPPQPKLSEQQIASRDRAEQQIRDKTLESITARQNHASFATQHSIERERYRAIQKFMDKANVTYKRQRTVMLDLSKRLLDDAASAVGTDRDTLTEIGAIMLDGVVGIAAGLPVDIYQTVMGKHWLTGEQLDSTDYALSVLGVFTGGMSSSIAKVGSSLRHAVTRLWASNGFRTMALSRIARYEHMLTSLGLKTSGEADDLVRAIEGGSHAGRPAAKTLDVLESANKGEWSKVFETGFKPKTLLDSEPLQNQFRSNKGIPGDWAAKPAKKGDGLIFHEPGNPHTDVRVMPGKPTSDYPNSRKPYVEVKKNGKYQDKNGNPLPNNQNDDAHIPLDEFQFPF